MALVLKDRVRESSITAGTGTITLDGPISGFQSFLAIGDDNTTYYAIVDVDTGAFEVGLGTYTASSATLSRDVVLESSNSGNLVDFAAGIKDVFGTYPAEEAVTQNDIQTLTNKTIAFASNTLTDVASTNTAQTLTNKTINLTSNTLVATSAQIAAAVTDETGTGALVFANSPTLVTPALGTPASGVVTNLTGTASININGTVGATTASTGAFTNLAYTGTLTGGTGVVNLGSGQLFKGTNGNVGIGTSSPARELSIGNGTGSPNIQLLAATAGNSRIEFGDTDDSDAGEIQYVHSENFMQFTTNGAERLRITSAGNVGIGTSSPAFPLNVTGSFGAAGNRFVARQGAVDQMSSIDNFSSGSDGGGISVNFDGRTSPTGASQAHFRDFDIYNGKGTLVVTVDGSAGNVGIGTSSPAHKLEAKSASATTSVRINAADSENRSVFIESPNLNQVAKIGTSGTGNSLVIELNSTERLRITSAGNVGIGTSAPSSRLHVLNTSAGEVARFMGNAAEGSANGFRIEAAGVSNRHLRLISGLNQIFRTFETNTGNAAGDSDIIFDSRQQLFRNGAGSERMRISSTGNVGIGTSSPGARLSVVSSDPSGIGVSVLSSTSGTALACNTSFNETGRVITLRAGFIGGDAPALAFNTGSPGIDRMRITSAGNVGIGTTSPTQTLDVNGGIKGTEFVGGGIGSYIRLRPGGVAGDNSIIIRGQSAENRIEFNTGSTGNAAERMRITSAGNVGIGTSSPGAKLVVAGGSAGNEILLFGGAGLTTLWEGNNISGNADTTRLGVGKNNTALLFTNSSGTPRTAFAIGTTSTEPLVLSTNNVERLRIDSAGNVGIGTSSPDAKLDVVGSVLASSGFVSSEVSVSVPNNTATTVLDLTAAAYRNRRLSVSVFDTGTHIGAVADVFVNWNGGVALFAFTQIFTGASSSALSLSGADLQLLHTFGSTRSVFVRVTII